MSPDVIQRYLLDNLPDFDLYDIQHVASCVLLRKSVCSESYYMGVVSLEYNHFPLSRINQIINTSV